MNVVFTIFLVLLGSSGISCRCNMYHLNEDEQFCAKSENLDADGLLDFFFGTTSENLSFANYLNCVFEKLNFITPEGIILFDNIIASGRLPWYLARVCEDVPTQIIKVQMEFKSSAIHCKENPPSVPSPSTVRKCITENYRSTPHGHK
ncbi:hypothetical protein PPYR_15272 [Photinus pyralis]|uniref:Uncharacterized protein n=1 Tax=Photinus pyralis TaxID=7054 RepID=A0A5N3ZZ58_PHOPY|nr:hypothetical protein PPYR_15272 [Photinus pyralis]